LPIRYSWMIGLSRAFLREQTMSQSEYEAQIAAFILRKGVTRCPTACVVPTQASIAEADRAALQRRSEQREAARAERLRRDWLRVINAA
jgi:hypothetical protein